MLKKMLCCSLILLSSVYGFAAGRPPAKEKQPPVEKQGKEKPVQDVVDVVYTWVDGGDPKWQKIRNFWYKKCFPQQNSGDGNSANRYRNRDELRYSLRSVYLYASFVNHIYIVTFGQRPAWLKDHPKITVVDHREIFPQKADLPTFNSHAIEANLHRIPNLADKFIYLNDDVFFGKHVHERDFFTPDGKIKFSFSHHPIRDGAPVPGEPTFIAAQRNTGLILNEHYRSEKRNRLAHAPFALKKSLIQKVEDEFAHVFHTVSSHKFRQASDYAITNGLIQYFSIYNNMGVQGDMTTCTIGVGEDKKKNKKNFNMLKKGAYHTFCLEDSNGKDAKEVDAQLREFLQSCYPFTAPWEHPHL